MPIEYSQLLATLIEETEENIADIDEALLSIDLNLPNNNEAINKIFRAIHTIKGNSAIFKLESISHLMHTAETLLDGIRNEITKIEKSHIELLFEMSDSMRTVLLALRNKKSIDQNGIEILTNKFQNLLTQMESEVVTSRTTEASTDAATDIATDTDTEKSLEKIASIQKDILEGESGWHIRIHPKKDLFKKNLDPILVFKMLTEEMPQTQIFLNPSRIPKDGYNADDCYLSWEIDVIGEISKQRLLEILTWIFDEKDLTLTKLRTKQKKKETAIPTPSIQKEVINIGPATTLRIATQKIDALMNAVGELVIIESMLKQAVKKMDPKQTLNLDEPLDLFDTNFRNLQDILLRIRMVPIGFAVNRFPRMIFEISNKMGKQVNFVIKGDQTEIDKNMIEKISDPLLHIIRNAIDHGIESPETREKKGKNETGTLQFNAFQESGNIVIEITDDGAGIDPEKIKEVALLRGLIKPDHSYSHEELYQLIFKPGFSTAEEITEYSGRGVGLDVVEKNIRSLGGSVQVSSTLGEGSTFKIRLPLTLAIMDSQIISIKDQIFAVPLLSIIEMTKIEVDNVIIEHQKNYYKYNDKKIPIIFLESLLYNEKLKDPLAQKIIIIVQVNARHYALLCDKLHFQQPVVIKNLEENFCKVPGVIGATIMGDGDIALILDVQELVEIANHLDQRASPKVHFFSQKFSFSKSNHQPQEINMPEIMNNEYLCFSLGRTEYAINMEMVKEISILKKPESLPFTPSYLAGVINLRGNIVPVVNLREFFHIKPDSYSGKGILIIIQLETGEKQKIVALLVDAITDTQSISRIDISPIPKGSQLLLRHYIQGLVYINQRIITLLQVENLVDTNTCEVKV